MDAIETRATLAERDDQPERAPSRFTTAALQTWITRITFLGIVATTLAFVAVYKPGAWILIGALAFGVCFMPRQGVDRRQVVTILLAVTVVLTTVDYLSWRIEVANWVYWGIVALPLLVAETFGALHTLGFQYTIWPRSQPIIVCETDPTLKPIFILIPTVNEGPAVLKPTILAAIEARRRYLQDFPRADVTIAVCNDGRLADSESWRDVEVLAVSLGVKCVTRTQGSGAKAGNIGKRSEQESRCRPRIGRPDCVNFFTPNHQPGGIRCNTACLRCRRIRRSAVSTKATAGIYRPCAGPTNSGSWRRGSVSITQRRGSRIPHPIC